jgi:beta-lactamase superfamily II metal-dependent hydrolase
MDKNGIAWYRTNTEGAVEVEGHRGKMVLEVWRI